MGLETTLRSNVEIGDVFSDQRLIGDPAGVGGGWRRDEEAGSAEELGLHEVEALQRVLAVRGGVGSSASAGLIEEFAKDCKIHGAVGVCKTPVGESDAMDGKRS